MKQEKQMLPERIAQEILQMITIEKRFDLGDKLPNEIKLSEELGVSRPMLREAIRTLVGQNVLVIRRGKGTFVAENEALHEDFGLSTLEHILPKARDIAEMRLIIEPESAYLAAKRATEEELRRILEFGRAAGEKLARRNAHPEEDYTNEEQSFHNAIAIATHNEFMMRVTPIINKGIWGGVRAAEETPELLACSLENRNVLLMCFQQRNAEGARAAMRIHLLLGNQKMGID